MNLLRTCAVACLVLVASGLAADDDKKAADKKEPAKAAAPLVIVDAAGKELKIKTWKYLQGTRRLSWLAPPPREDKPTPPKEGKGKASAPPEKAKDRPAPPAGPEALEFREENSTTYVNGILTLVPVERIKAIEYDNGPAARTVVVKVVGVKPDELLEIKGTTKYRGSNKLILEAEVDRGAMGVAALKFQGGTRDGGVQALRFASAKTGAPPTGKPATIVANDKLKTKHQVRDLKPVYRRADGHLQTLPYLMFKKTLKIDLAKVKSIKFAMAPKSADVSAEVALANGETLDLTLLPTVTIDGKPAKLEGLVGKAAAGFKLFPPHTITELSFEAEAEKP